MSTLSGNRGRNTVNGYRNRLDRILREIDRNAREARLDNNNRRDEMDEIVEDIRREINRVHIALDSLRFEDA